MVPLHVTDEWSQRTSSRRSQVLGIPNKELDGGTQIAKHQQRFTESKK
jgi:hypothetical protein